MAFVNLAASVDYRLNPGGDISIEVDALEAGSFRARLRRTGAGSAGFFSDGLKQIFWSIVSSLIFVWLFQGQHVTVKVDRDQVTIEGPDQTVIVSRSAYEGARAVSEDREVKGHAKEFFDALELDPEVRGVGLESEGGKGGKVHFPREQIGRLSENLRIEPILSRRRRTERARLTILKPSLHKRPQKWSFEWNGVPISARITDEAFLSTMKRREFVFGYGDALDVELAYEQQYDEATDVFINDNTTYEVQKVSRHIPSR